MALKPFDFTALQEIDQGRIKVLFNQGLRRGYEDCVDRPGLEKPRTVTMVIEMVPVPDDRGQLDSVNVRIRSKESMPTRDSRVYSMANQGNQLLFNEVSPDNVKQGTLDAIDKARRDSKEA